MDISVLAGFINFYAAQRQKGNSSKDCFGVSMYLRTVRIRKLKMLATAYNLNLIQADTLSPRD